MNVQFIAIRNLIEYNREYSIKEASFLIEQYILYRTGRTIKCTGGDTSKFEKAVTTADNYFKATYKKTWH